LGRNDWADVEHPAFVLRLPELPAIDFTKPNASTFQLREPFSGSLSLRRPPPSPAHADSAAGIPASQLKPAPTPEETEFKHKVYEDACKRAAVTRKFFAGVPKEDLTKVENGKEMRKDAGEAAKRLLVQLRADLKKQQAEKDPHALKVESITFTSGYRDPQYDFGLWDKYYKKYYKQTQKKRAKAAGGEHSDAAAELLARYIGKYKAAPGYSNHTQGIAFDIVTTEDGVDYTADKDQNDVWESTWLRKWMLKNAGNFGFKKLATEAWHWDYKN
jgi:hypothetical protein